MTFSSMEIIGSDTAVWAGSIFWIWVILRYLSNFPQGGSITERGTAFVLCAQCAPPRGSVTVTERGSVRDLTGLFRERVVLALNPHLVDAGIEFDWLVGSGGILKKLGWLFHDSVEDASTGRNV